MKTERREVLGVLVAAVGSALLPGPFAVAEQTPAELPLEKEAVSGISGFFFRVRDAKVLAQWYQDHLGIFVTPRTVEDPVWQQQTGPTSFTPLPERATYFDPAKQWMVNVRVGNLDRLVGHLNGIGIAVR